MTVISFQLLILIFTTLLNAIEVKKWEPTDFTFKAIPGDINPFNIKISAKVTRPDQSTFETFGFYNGKNEWIIRIAADMEGKWVVETKSELKKLEGHLIRFTCIPNTNPKIHGKLKVKKDNPYSFVFEDETVPFILGYEADFLWSMDLGNSNISKTEEFLDKINQFGFNYIVMNAFAYDTQWCKGKTNEFDFGPPKMLAWEGGITNPNFSRLNTDYWKHYDRVINAIHKRGMTAHIMFKVYNKAVTWPVHGSSDDDKYFEYIVNRYAAYPNIIWDFSKEAFYEKDIEYKKNRLNLIRKTDPYHHLITLHDDNEIYKGYYDNLIDFHADQFQGNTRYDISIEQRKYKKWPYMNIEFGYEHGINGLDDKTYNNVEPPKDVLNSAWEISMAGSYVVYYYTNTAWDVIKYKETPIGYQYFKIFSDFFRTVNYNEFSPVALVPEFAFLSELANGCSMVRNNNEFIFYRFNNSTFDLKQLKQTPNFSAYWLNPYTGEKCVLENLYSPLIPPGEWGIQPVVLYISTL